MHVNKFLHKILGATIHVSRIKSLAPVVLAIIMNRTLKLTQLGRNLNTLGQERAGIRRVDRLLANDFYQNENIKVYESITRCVVGSKTRPIIIVDWTGLPNTKRKTNGGEYVAIRATLAAKGRSITLYDEVHSKKKENNRKVNKTFLKNLKLLLPEDCNPIIVTDAGFKNPWFLSVITLGWDYVGRIRGDVCYDEGDGFKKITSLFSKAGKKVKYLGRMVIAKTNPLEMNVFIYKHKLKGRKKLTKTGKADHHKDSRSHARGYREPWLLVSSLTEREAKKVAEIYKLRMTIEENIRDVKSNIYGLGMNENETVKPTRLIVWLMLSALASLIAWVVGYRGEEMKLHHEFQANTYRHKRVLSYFYLGCQIIKKRIDVPIDLTEIQSKDWGLNFV